MVALIFCKLSVRNPKSRLEFIKDATDSLVSESKAIVGADKKSNAPRRSRIVCTRIEITDFPTPDKTSNTTDIYLCLHILFFPGNGEPYPSHLSSWCFLLVLVYLQRYLIKYIYSPFPLLFLLQLVPYFHS